MKKIILSLFVSTVSMSLYAQVSTQTVPGTTLLNSSSNNSISGVNPNGNPGTILYNNSNSAAVKNTLIQPNNTVTTTIISTPNNSAIVTKQEQPVSPAPNNVTTVVTSTAVNPNVSATTAVETKIETPVTPQIPEPVKTTVSNNNTTVVQMQGNTMTGLKPLATSPVLTNYVPEVIVNKLKTMYGERLYDITMLKKSDNQLLYIVRVKESAGYITHYLNAEGNETK